MSRPLAVVCLAAGMGKRTKVSIPKVLLPICGRTLLACSLDATDALQPQRTVVVVHHQKELVEKELASRKGLTIVDQGKPMGTGHAVKMAMQAIADFDGEVLVTYGDCPLITTDMLQALRDSMEDSACAVLTAFTNNPTGLGRVLRDEDDNFVGIREHRDCDEDELEINEVNTGFYCFDSSALRRALLKLKPDNAQGEYYLTDVIEQFAKEDLDPVTFTLEDGADTLGVNSLAELGIASLRMQERILLRHLANGVMIMDPATTRIDHDVEIGPETKIHAFTVISSGCKVGRGCDVGPFAHLRAGTVLEDGAEIGNFVEVKKSRVGAGSKAKHLTYLGDAVIGKKANIGAGTITANYDGTHKHETKIGDGCFVGSGTVIVAPSELGPRSMTGAGAIVKRDSKIEADEVWVGVPARMLKRRDAKPAKAAEEKAR